MSTITVSIGRNVPNDVPLSAVEWRTFRNETVAAVAACADNVHFVGTGDGIYMDEIEESHTVVATVPRHLLAELRATLGILAVAYRQHSVAVTDGATVFVTGR